MPRKDGTPTSAERKDAERIEGNRKWLLTATDQQIAECWTGGDEVFIAQLQAELARRKGE